MKKEFIRGIKEGFPIFLGYFSVSFGFGILAVELGLSVLAAVGISLTNLTSAGQVAGVGIIAAGGTLIEMALTQFVINLRYSLMGISLSQKLDESFNTFHRMVVSFGITDEIFALASAQKSVSPYYMYGIICVSSIGWVSGTFFGAAAGNVLPEALSGAMGLMLYGMFLAIFIPEAKKSRGVLSAVLVAAGLSIAIKHLFTFISGGFSVIICSVVAAALCALLFPLPPEKEAEE